MIDAGLLRILCCPETHQPLALAERVLIERLNLHITRGTLQNRGGQVVTEKLDDGLIRQDGQFLYPIRKGIPVMLIDEAIPLAGHGLTAAA